MTTDPKTNSSSSWMRLFLLFFVGCAIAVGGVWLKSKESFAVVDSQLQALRNHRISKAYYEYTSQEFQNTITLPQFREFLSIYPSLHNNVSFRISTTQVENDHALVTGILVSQEMEELGVEWGLVKEEGEWKIASLRLREIEGSDLVEQQMIDFVKEQLLTLKEQDFSTAYEEFISSDFREETSLEDFERFLQENPILFSYRTIDSEKGRVESDKGFVTLHLSDGSHTYLLDYVLSREADQWKVYRLKVILPPQIAAEKAATNPQALIPPVKELLEALSSDQIDRAYQLTSKDFQESTSYESFLAFVKAFPAFTEREMADIKRGEVQNGTGKVRVNLHDEEGMTLVDFRMGFSEGEWSIWGIEVVDSPSLGQDESSNISVGHEATALAKQLTAVLHRQIQYLRHQDIDEAYNVLMSQDYRAEHSLVDFGAFFAKHPVFLSHQSSYFHRIQENDNRIVMRGIISAFNRVTYPVRFDFVDEEGVWKIDAMQFLTQPEPIAEAEIVLDKPQEDLPPKPLEFTKVVIGTQIDPDGFVVEPKDEIEADIDFLFFNIHIAHGQPQARITLYLEHIDSGTSAPPLSAVLDREGESAISFTYAAPEEGWPPGDYVAKIVASTGQESLLAFRIKEKAAPKP